MPRTAFFFGLNSQLLKLILQLRWSNLHFICISTVQIISFYVSILSRVKMNSINWPAPYVWVSIARNLFSGLNLQLLKLRLQLRWSHLHFTWDFTVVFSVYLALHVFKIKPKQSLLAFMFSKIECFGRCNFH